MAKKKHKEDPAIQQVRDVRHQISASVNHDPQALIAYYLERQRNREKASERELKQDTKSTKETNT